MREAEHLRVRFPSFDAFAIQYNPDKQVDIARDERAAIMGNFSTLSMIDHAFGLYTAAKWIAIQINDLNKFSGSKTMNEGQTESLAYLLASEYRDMKFSMMMLFFFRFKCGDFGKFYEMVDPMIITCSLKDFTEVCRKKRQQYMDEEYAARRAEEQQRWKVLCQRWDSCRDELVRRCDDATGKRILSCLELYAYDESQNIITLQVDHEGYEQVEGKFFPLFSEVFRQHFPHVKVQYSLYPRRPVAKSTDGQRKATVRKPDAVCDICHSARRIINNELGVDSDVLEGMRYAFKLRYKSYPEEYLKAYSQ